VYLVLQPRDTVVFDASVVISVVPTGLTPLFPWWGWCTVVVALVELGRNEGSRDGRNCGYCDEEEAGKAHVEKFKSNKGKERNEG